MITPARLFPPTVVCVRSRPGGGRSGFSLLEVLIAMFILTVGMLGIAAVVVIGNMSAMRALVADRVATVGRNALAEVRVRQMLDATRWLNVDGSPIVANRDLPLPMGEAFCIDPLFIAAINAQQGSVPNGLSADLARFPYYQTSPTGLPVLTMRRISVNIADSSLPQAIQTVLINRRLWERIVVGQDDLVVDTERLTRPRLLFRTDSDAAVPFPLLPGDTGSGQPLYADFQGMYSWMVTVVPQVPSAPGGTQKYLVSAVVFRDRNLYWRDDPVSEAPGERVVNANFLGGGDLRLSAPQSDVGTRDPAEYLEAIEGQYILLAGRALVGPGQFQNVFLWYRIVAAGDLVQQNNAYYREITVVGPDWNPAWSLQANADTDGDGVAQETQAVLCTNVYGVYTQVIDVDALSRLSLSTQ